MKFSIKSTICVSVTVMGAAKSQQLCNDDDQTCTEIDDLPCGVYMAPSTIGVANMGIYTGIDMRKGEVVNYPEIAIPLLFRDWGYHGENPDGTLWDRYIWDHGVANTEPKKSDLEREDTSAVFVPGVGCTVNSRLDMHNILSTHGSIYDHAGLHRSRDPGSGAFSPYHSSQTVAQRNIVAGSELFAAYGDNWIPEIPGAIISFDDNMDDADDFLDEYKEWIDSKPQLSDDLKEGLWSFTSKDLPYNSKVLGALPKQHDWKTVNEELENKTGGESTSRHFVDKIGYHTPEWLRENGHCQDHLRPGRSTIAQAGRGAFAARALPKGTVVGYSPLIHIGNAREILQIDYNVGRQKYTQEDLVINYSFGHKDSTVVLTPYGAMVNYINHHREKANVRVEWPKDELVAHKPEWLGKDIEFIRNVHDKIGLSFNYVALRDIEDGEEIFMDYGDEWVEAWEEHVRNWSPGPEAYSYSHATEWPEEHLRTLEELGYNPYPPNLHTLCYDSYKLVGDEFVYVPPSRNKHLRKYCDVLARHTKEVDGEVEYYYTIRLHLGKGENVVVHEVGESGVELTDKIKTADWHLPNGFRHTIMIPDDIMPESWKNSNGEDSY